MIKKQTSEKKGLDVSIDTEEMMGKGLHLGHIISKLHPKMFKNIVGVKNTVHIIDLEKTAKALEQALLFVSELFKDGGSIILVGTKPPLRGLVRETAEDCGIPYVVERWLGGTFTNFKVISNRVKYYKDIEKQKEEGKFESLLKKERIKIDKGLEKLGRKFDGIKNLEKVPEAVFICDISQDQSCFREAKRMGVKVVAIVDTNVDPSLVDYPIPANDDAIPSVQYILEKLKKVIKKSKPKIKKQVAEDSKPN